MQNLTEKAGEEADCMQWLCSRKCCMTNKNATPLKKMKKYAIMKACDLRNYPASEEARPEAK